MRLRSGRVVDRVINAVDGRRLGWFGSRRHGEIGIAARFTQHVELVVNPTLASLRMGIVQGPVAVNEAVPQLTRLSIPAEKPVPAGQQLLVTVEPFAQGFAIVVVVMKVHLYLAISLTAQLGQGVHFLRLIHLKRVKECVARRLPVAIAELIEEPRIVLSPLLNATAGEFN